MSYFQTWWCPSLLRRFAPWTTWSSPTTSVRRPLCSPRRMTTSSGDCSRTQGEVAREHHRVASTATTSSTSAASSWPSWRRMSSLSPASIRKGSAFRCWYVYQQSYQVILVCKLRGASITQQLCLSRAWNQSSLIAWNFPVFPGTNEEGTLIKSSARVNQILAVFK